MMTKSPLTGSERVILVEELDSATVIKKYQHEFRIDVSRYFEYHPKVSIYQCEESGLRFYYPFSLAGDAEFYAQLSQNYKGYYSVWKWEHQKVFDCLKKRDKILEIGCGNGYFLDKAKSKEVEGVGLDFNPEAIQYGKRNNIRIIDESIASHARTHTEQYDLVCAFQLFEHVNDVGVFLKDTIATLKKGGILAIGVPNNDSYVFKSDLYHTLNVPPHHILLWDAHSLAYIAQLFDLQLVEIALQPASSGHRSGAYHLWLKNKLGHSILSSTIHLLTRWLVKLLPVFREGNTVVAVYRK